MVTSKRKTTPLDHPCRSCCGNALADFLHFYSNVNGIVGHFMFINHYAARNLARTADHEAQIFMARRTHGAACHWWNLLCSS